MQNKPLEDLPSWMIRITIDFLSTSMFHTDYHTLEVIRNQQGQVVETEGMAFIRSLTCVTKEYMMKAPLKPCKYENLLCISAFILAFCFHVFIFTSFYSPYFF